MGVDVMDPEGRREESMAESLEAFSSFVLGDEGREACASIIDRHMDGSAGELQGGSEEHSVYRVTIGDGEDGEKGVGGGAAADMLREFRSSRSGRRHAATLTFDRLRQYMLGICNRRSRERGCGKYGSLGNLMFVVAFGPTGGQVRHIDNMDPNLQVCLYMSRDCASTVVYSLGGHPIESGSDLIDHWGRTLDDAPVPGLVGDVLRERGGDRLEARSCTRAFAHWHTVDSNLRRFGKLYRDVSSRLALIADPGTTMVAGGNEVHAGPPTSGPRMFAFAIGVPEEGDRDADGDRDDNDGGEDNNGEVQYNPVLLHVDLCCILFALMDVEYPERQDSERREARRFLLSVLPPFIQEYPNENYGRLLGDDRSELRDWLRIMVEALRNEDGRMVKVLLEEAAESESMFYCPGAGGCKNSKRRRQAKKKKGRNDSRRGRG